MKFTRMLSLAVAAAAALSFTACDDSTSSEEASTDLTCTGPISSSTMTINTGDNALTVGTQKAPSGSFVSLKNGKVWNATTLAANNYAAWDSIDLIVFADSSNRSSATFYSPKRAKEVFKGTSIAKNPSSKSTLFKKIGGEDYDLPIDFADLKTQLGKISFSATGNDQAAVTAKGVYAARIDDGRCALVDVQTINAGGEFNVSLGLDLYK